MDKNALFGLLITAFISGLVIYQEVRYKKMGYFFLGVSIILIFTFSIILPLLLSALVVVISKIVSQSSLDLQILGQFALIIAAGFIPVLGLTFFFLLGIGSPKKDNIWQFFISFIILFIIPLFLFGMLGGMLYQLWQDYSGGVNIELSLKIVYIFFSLVIGNLLVFSIKNRLKGSTKTKIKTKKKRT